MENKWLCFENECKGENNLITDVPNVKVGHTTIDTKENKTGVTVIIPCEQVYDKKPVAAVYSLNGYGKTMGTVQIEELGVLESPIALTNTLNVGKVADAIVQYTLNQSRDKKRIVSVNAVVGETNDSRINHIEKRAVNEEHVLSALENASVFFEQGDIGAGKGTVCFGLKGGIGSSSRVITFDKKKYTIGVLVQSNFGRIDDLRIGSREIGKEIQKKLHQETEPDKGSIMVIIGTDIPLSSRQLKRVLKRAAVGLVRTGSCMGHGSGDIFIGFTNGNYLPDTNEEKLISQNCFPENQMDKLFRPTASAVEEAILNSMYYADAVEGIKREIYHSIREFL